MELRFSNQQKVYNFVYEAVKEAFHQKELIPKVALPEAKIAPPPPERDLDYFMKKMKERVTSYHNQASQAEVKNTHEIHRGNQQIDRIREAANYAKSHVVEKTVQQPVVTEKPVIAEQLDLFEEKLLTKEAIIEHKIIGQLFDTYWLVEYHEQLYIIDQHAAHERVLYERTLKEMKTREFTSQYLSPPLVLNLSMQEEEVLNTYMDNFTSIGFEIEPFGTSSYAVRAVPGNLFSIAKKELLLEMLDSLVEGIHSSVAPDLIAEKVASMSCKSAVKGNSRLSRSEVEVLIKDLLQLENPYHCPHGRPTIISMTKRELEKKFKRII